EPEEGAERRHLPTGVDPVADTRQDKATEDASIEQTPLERLLVTSGGVHLSPSPYDVGEHEQVEPADYEQEAAGNGGAECAAGLLNAGDRHADHAGAQREPGREGEDDRRMADREEEAHAERPPAVVQQLARRVVDRSDVVSVEGVTQAECVGKG